MSAIKGQDMIDKLIGVYKDYGFNCEKKYLPEGLLVFTLNNGYFNNAEIVSVEDNKSTQKVFDSYTQSGYACTVRRVRDFREVEASLFEGFFFVDSTKDRLRSDYARFSKSITSPYSENAIYQYINAPYFLNNVESTRPITQEVLSRLGDEKPALFLIEAAAGFGKTCTAYEVVNEILATQDRLPLFSELSRNRAAKIFRYVLLDEIDRTFPQLKSRLVESEIRKGRVVVVLDGFDELLRKSESGDDFEAAEPMLETIGQLLQGSAKVILTTRRTVIFEGDDFHRWVDNNVDIFDVVRFKLNEPRISDWLSAKRRERLECTGFDISGIANPVLLSYLRCMSEEEFEKSIADGAELVEKYFEYMLDRERARQDLRLDVKGQYAVLAGIAKDMIDLGYTSESREYIVDFVKASFIKLLDDIRGRYSSSEKPSRDEVANKLASHALLDKSINDDSKIGFINEFVFGNFIAENILAHADWMNDDLRFLEPAVMSYLPRNELDKLRLRSSLGGVMDFLAYSDRIDFSVRLGGGIDFDLTSGEADGLSLLNVRFGDFILHEFQFNDCDFKNCSFIQEGLSDVTFLNCRFYECGVVLGKAKGAVHVLGCIGDLEFIEELSRNPSELNLVVDNNERKRALDKYILEKFWPVGTQSFHRRRPIKGICSINNDFTTDELYSGIVSLKRRGLIFEPSKASFLEIAIDRIGEIRAILGKQMP